MPRRMMAMSTQYRTLGFGRNAVHEPLYNDKAQINALTQRASLGLSEEFQNTRLVLESEQLERAFAALGGTNSRELVELVSSPTDLFNRRYAAGVLLGHRGDPRISALKPVMAPVPGGRVEIGLDVSQVDAIHDRYRGIGVKREWIAKECPRHVVDLAPYKLGLYPVTQDEFAAFLKETASSEIPEPWRFGVMDVMRRNHPVHGVTLSQAMAYCEWLSGKTGRRFRLPTEAEWEFAAKGPSDLEFPWGNDYAPDHCNTAEEMIFDTTPVGMFPKGRGPFGHYDLGGNVEEFTSTPYGPYPGGALIVDDLLEKRGEYNVARGGSFTRFRDLARCKRRHGHYLSPIYVMGFRLCEGSSG